LKTKVKNALPLKEMRTGVGLADPLFLSKQDLYVSLGVIFVRTFKPFLKRHKIQSDMYGRGQLHLRNQNGKRTLQALFNIIWDMDHLGGNNLGESEMGDQILRMNVW
jgi:hypothetical protein